MLKWHYYSSPIDTLNLPAENHEKGTKMLASVKIMASVKI